MAALAFNRVPKKGILDIFQSSFVIMDSLEKPHVAPCSLLDFVISF
jgi:hypothetical protein